LPLPPATLVRLFASADCIQLHFGLLFRDRQRVTDSEFQQLGD
jgi:hypothetical protein